MIFGEQISGAVECAIKTDKYICVSSHKAKEVDIEMNYPHPACMNTVIRNEILEILLTNHFAGYKFKT